MELSELAHAYLQKQKRNMNATCDARAARNFFAAQGFTQPDAFIDFQVTFSGYILTIQNEPNHTMELYLVGTRALALPPNSEGPFTTSPETMECGSHDTAPFRFLLRYDGAICTLDNEDRINPVYASTEVLIEEYARRNELAHWHRSPYYKVRDLVALKERLRQDFTTIGAASDPYNAWWQNHNHAVELRTALDRPYFVVRVYAATQTGMLELAQSLQHENFLQ